jgi:TetR/AcrR family transcriptional regulator, mexJK operon transcriptional repressor
MIPSRTTGRRTVARRGGRPKAADVDKLNQDIITAAGDLFMEFGFDGTSMDAIAERARISKRTLYLRHKDKSALFNTVVYELLGRFLVPLELSRYTASDLDSALLLIGRDMVTSVTRPEFLAVYRLVTFEAQRRPEFGRWINDARRRPAIQVIGAILQQHQDELRPDVLDSAPEHFLSVTVDVGLRMGVFGIKMTPRQIESHLNAAVDFFLNGVRRHDGHGKVSNRRARATSGA